jgi:hypothetical protein
MKFNIFSNQQQNSNFSNLSLLQKAKIIALKTFLISMGLALFVGLIYLVVLVSIFLLVIAGGLFLFFFLKGNLLNKKKSKGSKNNSKYKKRSRYNEAYKVNYKLYDEGE